MGRGNYMWGNKQPNKGSCVLLCSVIYRFVYLLPFLTFDGVHLRRMLCCPSVCYSVPSASSDSVLILLLHEALARESVFAPTALLSLDTERRI